MSPDRPITGLTVLVPAYNEAESIVDTVRSIQNQTVPPDEIIVIDDHSRDNTGDLARGCGATVLRPSANTGAKAGALNFALAQVKTPYVMAIDADTTLERNAIEKLLPSIKEPGVAAASGFVVPRYVRTIWERGRYVEYLFTYTLFKPIQDYYGTPMVASGCFSVHRTEILQAAGGWNTRTVAEDMDLTWSYFEAGYKVRFVPEAICYPIEPHDRNFMGIQLKRWSHGFFQNVVVHWRGLSNIPVLRMMVAVSLWDALVATAVYLLAIPLLAIFVNPFFLLGYLIDIPCIAIPVLYKAIPRGETLRALAGLPSFFLLRFVNAYYLFEAFWSEIVIRRSLKVFEKGH